MATVYTDTLFETKYKDDFNDSDGYYRILFNSGRALQARELTQMQTIINKQVERFGNNIFKEGSAVKPGGLEIDTTYEFVKFDGSSTSTTVAVGDILTGATSGIKAEVLQIVAAVNSDPVTIYVRYVDTTSVAGATTTPRFTPGESLGSGRVVQIANTDVNPAVGRGTRALIGDSIYFTQGFFVYTEAQAAIISKYSDAPNVEVGFKITQEVKGVDDNIQLYDNQGATINTTAPGADRYCIKLILTAKSDLLSDDNFIHVNTVKNGAIFSAVKSQQDDMFNIPRDMIATRIHENSGDYIVKPYRITFEEDSSANHLLLKVSDGIVVVDGYRAARFLPTDIQVERAQNDHKIDGEFMPVDYGNFVDVLGDSAVGGPDITTFAQQTLKDARNFGGSSIGTARVRAVHENGADLRYHLFDIKMNAGKSFRDARSIGTSGTSYFNPNPITNNIVLEDPLNNTLVYDTLKDRPKIIDPQQIEVQILRSGTSDGAGNFTVSIPSAYTLTNTSDWLVFSPTGKIATSGLGGITGGSNTTTITGLPNNTAVSVYVYGVSSTPVVRAKTLTSNATVTTTIATDPITGEKFLNLGQPDIFEVKRVSVGDSDGAELDYKFDLDDGQRDNFYGLGRMVLKDGETAPVGNVYVKFDHFSHGAGNFFAVNSYTGVVDYNKIPSFTRSNGDIINLRDAYDFRPVVNSSGNFVEANISYLPTPTDFVTSDNTYYLARAHKLIIDTEGELDIIQNVDAFDPTAPDAPAGTLPLYNFAFFPNTLDEHDVTVEKIDHRRYTMDDINKLEARIANLEEVTSLNMLELATSNFEVLDSSGLNRTKSGFFVDNFTTHMFSDAENDAYMASIDPSEGIMRPMFTENNLRMLFDSATSTGVVRKGDNIYLEHTEETFMTQPFATQATKINPYTSSNFTGNLQLSPASDEWKDTNVTSRSVIDGGSQLSLNQATNWNNWEWNWGGKELEELRVGDQTNTISKISGRTTTKTVNKVVSESTLEEIIGTRVLQVSLLPFIRSRIISIRAQGLRPNTNVFLFMDGKNMASFVREAPFARYSSSTKDHGNNLRGKTAHIDGAGLLTTDITGKVDISFMIPNNNSVRFRSGTHEIKVMDVETNKETNAGSVARASYTAQGVLNNVHQDVRSTRMLEIEGSKSSVTAPAPAKSRSNDDGKGAMWNHWQAVKNLPGVQQKSQWNSTLGMITARPQRGNQARFTKGAYTYNNKTKKLERKPTCFAHDTLFRMVDGSTKKISDIEIGDIMFEGGHVYAVIQGDGTLNDWYNYNGIHVTGDHPVFDEGTWKRVKDVRNKKLKRIQGYDKTYTLLNTNHLMISHNNTWFTDYDEIEWCNNPENEQYVLDKLNNQSRDVKKTG